jgi:hypothetical protein
VPSITVLCILAGASSAEARQSLDGTGKPKGSVLSARADFERRHGDGFHIDLDQATGFARAVFGRPIAAPPSAPTSAEEFELLARALLHENESLFGLQNRDLVLDDVVRSPLEWIGTTDKIGVLFHQEANGLTVRGGHATVLFLEDGTIVGVDCQVWPDAALVDPLPSLTSGAATEIAAADFARRTGQTGMVLGEIDLVIEPHLVNGFASSRLAYLVTLGAPGRELPLKERLAIDAHSGEVLTRDNLIHTADLTGTVNGWATPGTKPDTNANPEQIAPIRRDTVTANGLGTTTTDTSGNFIFSGVPSGTYTVSASLNGPFVFVQNSAGSEASVSVPITTGTPGTLTFNTGKTEDRTAEVNAYYWAESMRDWILSVDPTYDLMGFKVTANVNIASTCNAYYDGSSINFYASGGGCVNTAYSTVVCHENGHWANDVSGSGNGGDGFGEGAADVWAMYQVDNPIVGEDFCGTGCNVRTGENTRQFCGDNNPGCYGEVHADGEVLMGAMWKVRKRLNQSLGNAAGDATSNALMVAWHKQFNDGQIKTFVRDHWLMLDDNDGNIDNGTPHYADIDNGFHDQGFPNYVKKAISIVHTPLPDTTDTTGPYVAIAKVTANIGNTITAVELYYDVGAGFVKVTMTATGNPDEYSGNIPGQQAPKEVAYYLRAADNLGNTRTSPDNAPGGGTYRFGVGNLDDVFFFDNFETSGDNGWTHGGTGQDDWQHGNPATSAYAGDPDVAYSGTKVWGNDLSLTGGDGMYEANVANFLTSPAINCTGKVGVHVRFARWLTIEQGIYDNAYVQVSNDGTNYNTVFANDDAANTLDAAWNLFTYDISLFADGKSSVRVRFRLESDGGLEFGGWNLDDVALIALTGNTDSQPPNAPSNLASPDHSVNVWSNVASTTVTWTAPSDPGGSGLDGYSVLWDHSATTTPDTSKDLEEDVTSYVQSLTNSPTGWYFHIRARDNAGNWGNAAHFGPILIDTQAPSGTISINNGASTTPSLIVTLSLSATDGESGMGTGAKMRFSNDGITYSAEESYASTRNNWDLSSFGGNGDPGTKTVFVQFRDVAGNLSAAFTDTIDFTPVPQISTIEPNKGPFSGGTQVTITGSGFTPSATVKFGASAATSVTYLSSTQLLAVTPAYTGLLTTSVARVDVAVTTTGGTGVLSKGFSYRAVNRP